MENLNETGQNPELKNQEVEKTKEELKQELEDLKTVELFDEAMEIAERLGKKEEVKTILRIVGKMK